MSERHRAAGRIGGRIGGLVRSSRYSPTELTAAAHAGTWAKFLREVDPENTLDEGERTRRAQAARTAYMRQLRQIPRATRQQERRPCHPPEVSNTA